MHVSELRLARHANQFVSSCNVSKNIIVYLLAQPAPVSMISFSLSSLSLLCLTAADSVELLSRTTEWRAAEAELQVPLRDTLEEQCEHAQIKAMLNVPNEIRHKLDVRTSSSARRGIGGRVTSTSGQDDM